MQDIFVSYRRQDSQSAAGRLSDHLRDNLPGIRIFRDVETIDPGVDFVDAIGRALKTCAVLIAVIGPRWLDARDAAGRRRLDDAHDYTRLEIASALGRKDVRVIPVLVEGAEMPSGADLPGDLAPLARRNAIELSDKRWDYDVSQLVATLRPLLGVAEPRPAPPGDGAATRPGKRGRRWAVAAAVLAVGGVALLTQEDGTPPLPTQQLLPQPVPPTTPQVPATSVAALNLSGVWADSEGGHYDVLQQGSQLMVRGSSPDGIVLGQGGLQGQVGWMTYTLNGYPLNARFAVAQDGNSLDVLVNDPSTGEQTRLQMWRAR